MDVSTLVPLPVRISPDFCCICGAEGSSIGVAVYQDLLVISCCNKLQVFALPDDIARGTPRELVPVRTLGGVAPMEFEFRATAPTGPFHPVNHMAFTDGGGGATLLLVADAGHDAVHVIDVVHGSHVGYVAAPGAIAKPRGVATRKSLVAVVSALRSAYHSDFVVRVFTGGGGAWTEVRVIQHQPWVPNGLRFSGDGMQLAVVDYRNCRLSIFCAQDGSLLRHIMTPSWYSVYPFDVEECDIAASKGNGVRAGWVMCHLGGLAAVANEDKAFTEEKRGFKFAPLALASVTGLGFVVRHHEGVKFLATPDAVAMASMSLCKVAWMAAVCRGRV